MDGFDVLMRALEQEKQKSKSRNLATEAASEIYCLMQSFVKAGFTEDQAFELVKHALKQ